jgi:hypothetical protein
MTHACPIARLRLAAIVLLLTSWHVVPLPAQELLKNPGFDQERDGKGLPAAWSASRDQVLWQERTYLSKDYGNLGTVHTTLCTYFSCRINRPSLSLGSVCARTGRS